MATSPTRLRVLLDTNVVLDWLFERKPWSDAALPLWAARAAGQVVMYIPASALTDIFYIGRRLTNIPEAFVALDRIFTAFNVVTVNSRILRKARTLPGNDSEDNVQIACAKAAHLDFIVTRNANDFVHSPVRTIEPPTITGYLPKP